MKYTEHSDIHCVDIVQKRNLNSTYFNITSIYLAVVMQTHIGVRERGPVVELHPLPSVTIKSRGFCFKIGQFARPARLGLN
jgi:hypothetical protein